MPYQIKEGANELPLIVPAQTVNDELNEPPTQDTSLADVLEMAESSVTMLTASEQSSPPAVPKRPTSGYAARGPDERPETEYSLPRTGTREVFADRPQGAQQATLDLPAPVPGGAIGRLRPTGAAKSIERKTPVPSRLTQVAPPPAPPRRPDPELEDDIEEGETRDWGSRDDFRTNPAQYGHPGIAEIPQVRARDSQTGREQRASLDLVGGVREQDVSAARDRIQQLRR